MSTSSTAPRATNTPTSTIVATLRELQDSGHQLATDALIGTRQVSPRETVTGPGHRSDNVWIVVEGWATAINYGASMGSIGPGDIIGDLTDLGIGNIAGTVIARTGMVLLEFDRCRFCEFVAHCPQLSLAIARMYAQKLRAASAWPPVEIW